MSLIDETTCTRGRAGRARGALRIHQGLRVIALTILMTAPAARAAEAPGPPDETEAGPVTLLATPGGGIQPQAAIDAAGVIHLVSFQGPPGGGDLVYLRIEPGQTDVAPPIR